jgi:hypothetical protein
LAIPSAATPNPVDFGAFRVGDPAPAQQPLTIGNLATAPAEGLNASISTGSPGFIATGSLTGLAPGSSESSTLKVGFEETAIAGLQTGTATITLASDGVYNNGVTTPLTSQTINMNAKVYTPAQAQVLTVLVDFGIVHVGDVVAARVLTVTNPAPITALNDVLIGNFSSPTFGQFTASGTLGAGVAAEHTDSTSLKVGLNTATAGVYFNNAPLQFQSHNPDMADLAFGVMPIQLFAQVNNFANPVFAKTAGSGSLSRAGDVFTLDLGTLALGGSATSMLGVLNDTPGPADGLDGAFELSTLDDFVLSGFTSFTDIAAGQLYGGLLVEFDAQSLGVFTDMIDLNARGYNASGFEETFKIYLELRADVIQGGGEVPEPATLLLLGTGLFSLWGLRRKFRK